MFLIQSSGVSAIQGLLKYMEEHSEYFGNIHYIVSAIEGYPLSGFPLYMQGKQYNLQQTNLVIKVH